jgi:hypothetical protein
VIIVKATAIVKNRTSGENNKPLKVIMTMMIPLRKLLLMI